MRVLFSINSYDKDGDVVDECVDLHLGSTILRFDRLRDLKDFASQITDRVIPEIEECYPHLKEQD